MTTIERLHVYTDAFNRRDFDTVRDLLHPAVVDHHLPPELPVGADGVITWLELLASALSLRVDIEQVVDAGDLVAASSRIRGTHVGDFPGMPATNRTFDVTMTTLERFENGLIVERWETYDHQLMIEQLTSPAR